jgi:hypothetical protein
VASIFLDDESGTAREHFLVSMFRIKDMSAAGDDVTSLFTISNPSLTSLIDVRELLAQRAKKFAIINVGRKPTIIRLASSVTLM